MVHINTIKRFGQACIALLSTALVACGGLDPVNVQSLCVGAGPFHEECPQCQAMPFASECPQCQQSGAGEETCLPPGTEWTSENTISGADGGISTSAEGGAGTDGTTPGSTPRDGEPGNSGAAGSGGQTPPDIGTAGANAQPKPDPGQQGPRGCVMDDDCTSPGFPACRPDGLCTECLTDSHCGEGRQCDRPTNRCVECVDAAGCEAKGKVCQMDTRTCVQCLDNNHCGGATPACTLGYECVACTNDSFCPRETPACDQMTCVECRADVNCNSPGKHACIEAEHRCVECEQESHCRSETGRPHCLASATTCVECLADTDCSDPSAAHCDSESHTCVPCTTATQCAAFADTAPRCAEGKCVACDGDGGVCKGKACVLSKNTCSTTDRQSVRACGECITSDECIPGHVCVNLKYGNGYDTGNFCLPNLPDFRACPRPFGRKVANYPTLDGFRVQTLCALPETTTCQAFLDTVAKKTCNSDNAACGLGLPMLGENDGRCPNTVCTYNCPGAEYCPDGMICSEVENVCL